MVARAERHMADRRDVVAARMFGPLLLTLAGRTVGARDLDGIKPQQRLEVLLPARPGALPARA
jgi:hypothetical protein